MMNENSRDIFFFAYTAIPYFAIIVIAHIWIVISQLSSVTTLHFTCVSYCLLCPLKKIIKKINRKF